MHIVHHASLFCCCFVANQPISLLTVQCEVQRDGNPRAGASLLSDVRGQSSGQHWRLQTQRDQCLCRVSHLHAKQQSIYRFICCPLIQYIIQSLLVEQTIYLIICRVVMSCIDRYLLEDGYSNMAIISVKMVSGWIPDKNSIKNVSSRIVQLLLVDKTISSLCFIVRVYVVLELVFLILINDITLNCLENFCDLFL